ncbi:MAG: cytochrome C [Deltaproteobacteria bacterium HGW-Deltaproteobacteria-4]|nr:MAG: cytochrome C [Deltaproteobacteria bacterium HGW-Deltaproteobacteria-4]
MKKPARRVSNGRRAALLLCLCLLPLLFGCDAGRRHWVLSTLFDGFPRLPPAEEYCQDYASQLAIAAPGDAAGDPLPGQGKSKGSQHLPFAEKRCNDCHAFEKPGGLLLPARELCFLCHVDFIQGSAVHGPVAVGDCLACHHPHNSAHPTLLLQDKDSLCSKCHQEKRLAGRMHSQLQEKGMHCSDCHNPHFGQTEYFLE